jgi:hypothetical protein
VSSSAKVFGGRVVGTTSTALQTLITTDTGLAAYDLLPPVGGDPPSSEAKKTYAAPFAVAMSARVRVGAGGTLVVGLGDDQGGVHSGTLVYSELDQFTPATSAMCGSESPADFSLEPSLFVAAVCIDLATPELALMAQPGGLRTPVPLPSTVGPLLAPGAQVLFPTITNANGLGIVGREMILFASDAGRVIYYDPIPQTSFEVTVVAGTPRVVGASFATGDGTLRAAVAAGTSIKLLEAPLSYFAERPPITF